MHNNDNLSLGSPDKSTHLVSISLTSVQYAYILATMKTRISQGAPVSASTLRAASRDDFSPSYRVFSYGFRCARTP